MDHGMTVDRGGGCVMNMLVHALHSAFMENAGFS